MKDDLSNTSLETTEEETERLFPSDDLTRRDIRALIFYLLYAAESFEHVESLDSIIDNFNRGFDLNISLDGEVAQTTQSIIDNNEKLDDVYKPLLTNWRFDRIGICTKLILRYAIWELEHTDLDPKIIINEAVELAKCFAEKDAYKFINGILDKVVKAGEEK